MRHGKKTKHLGRTASHRKAMLANMACSLIEHKRINTTVAKAKALKGFIEPLITKSKDDNTHNRRIVFSYLRSKEAVAELFREVVDKVGDRPGGYTRIIRTGNRLGDNAEMCMLELVDFNEIYTNEKSGKSKTTRRSRRGGKKKTSGEGQQQSSAKSEASKSAASEAIVKEAEEKKEEKPKDTPAEASVASAEVKAAEKKPEEKAQDKAEEVAGKDEKKAEKPAAEKKEENKDEDKK